MRTLATADGGSTMEEVTVEAVPVDFVPGKPSLGVSPSRRAREVKFLQVGSGWDGGWHPSPARQYLIPLSGGFRIQTSDGKVADFRPGDVVLLEDTTGKGHHTTMLGGVDSWIVVAALD